MDENNNSETVDGARPSQMGERESDDDHDNDEGENVEDVEFVEAGMLLDQDDGLEYVLPKHHRCTCHLLYLVSTVDVFVAHSKSAYKKLSRSATKCSSLWNKSPRSTTAAEIIQENCKLQLLSPNDTRWNSLFLAVERIVRIVREPGERASAAVSSALKIPM